MKPESIVVRWDGREYERDLALCRRILLQRAIEGGHDYDTHDKFAKLIRISRSTLRLWLNGRTAGTKQTTMRILAGLKLEFHEVHKPRSV